MSFKPVVAITMGDPASIGPEITIKALAGHTEIYDECKPIVIGDACVMENAKKFLPQYKDIVIHAVEKVEDAKFEPGTIDVYDMKLVNIDELKIG